MKRIAGIVLSALIAPLVVSAQEGGARSPPNQGSGSSPLTDSGCFAGAVQPDTTGGYGTGVSGSCGSQSGSGSDQGVGGTDGTQSGRAGVAMNEGSGDTYGTQPNQGVSADSSQSPAKINQGANAMGSFSTGGVGESASPNRQPAEGLSAGGAGGMASFMASGGPAGSTQNDYSAGFDSGTALY